MAVLFGAQSPQPSSPGASCPATHPVQAMYPSRSGSLSFAGSTPLQSSSLPLQISGDGPTKSALQMKCGLVAFGVTFVDQSQPRTLPGTQTPTDGPHGSMR